MLKIIKKITAFFSTKKSIKKDLSLVKENLLASIYIHITTAEKTQEIIKGWEYNNKQFDYFLDILMEKNKAFSYRDFFVSLKELDKEITNILINGLAAFPISCLEDTHVADLVTFLTDEQEIPSLVIVDLNANRQPILPSTKSFVCLTAIEFLYWVKYKKIRYYLHISDEFSVQDILHWAMKKC